MTLPALGVAMLLAGAPVDPGSMPPQAPIVLAATAASDREVGVPALPAVAADPPAPAPPAESPLPTDPAPAEGAASASGAGTDHSDIVVTAQSHAPPGDPLQELNATSFEATQAVDRAFVRPVAMGYRQVVPRPIRSGFRNFLSNLTEPVIFLNFLLQLKPGKAAETVGRFAINSTIGAAGLFDMAKRRPFKLPYRPNGFAYTMGYYGVKTGPFLYLPLIGPTTVRDVIGLGLDRLVVPIAVGKPFNRPAYSIPTATLSSLDQRAQFDTKLQKLHDESDRPYAATREDYLKNRQAEIDELRGRHPDAGGPEPERPKPEAD